MTTRAQLLARIARFCRRNHLSDRQFSLAAVGDHRLVARLKAGRGVTLTMIERAERFMEARGAGQRRQGAA